MSVTISIIRSTTDKSVTLDFNIPTYISITCDNQSSVIKTINRYLGSVILSTNDSGEIDDILKILNDDKEVSQGQVLQFNGVEACWVNVYQPRIIGLTKDYNVEIDKYRDTIIFRLRRDKKNISLIYEYDRLRLIETLQDVKAYFST